MNNKPSGKMEIDRKKGICILFVMLMLVNLAGCGNGEEGKENIDYGIEVRTDINGDGKTDRVRVMDTVNGDYADTQVCATINEGNVFYRLSGFMGIFLSCHWRSKRKRREKEI